MCSVLQHDFLLYGANGYTGRLIAAHASEYGLKPLLAGRSEAPLQQMATDLQLPFVVVDLDDNEALLEVLRSVKLVLHAAGPFEHTAKQMVEACLQAGTHYLDINGDVAIFEFIKTYHDAALKAGLMLMPGVGFDVVPTDCIALRLKTQMPDAIKLELAFASQAGGLSHGTATTMVSKIGEGGVERINGKITKVPLGAKGMTVNFFTGTGKPPRNIFVMSIPWGDVATAYTTTGIPNITTYTGMSPKVFYLLKAQAAFNWLLRTPFVRKMALKKIKSLPAGPSPAQRNTARSMVWGCVTNRAGAVATARLCGPDGYTLTMHSALIIVKKVLENNFTPGYQTPAKCYGASLIAQVPGVEISNE
ncbi:MAG: hypothetical protein EOO03_05285 [Chitinophagaceae bacterium]|nr:MAG: hypothetical protein EOO03_05285 [Chitinophagaceae bacterium]